MGADGIELDVRLSSDGHLVVHHDDRLDDGRTIVATPLADLPEHVPTLEQALDACGDVRVNIEIKNSLGDASHDPHMSVCRGVVGLVAARSIESNVLISSFDLATIDEIRRLDADLATAFLVYRGDVQALLELGASRGHRAIHPWDRQVDQRFIDIARRLDLEVNVWTVDDPVRIKELASLGVDGVVTNVPDIARTAIG